MIVKKVAGGQNSVTAEVFFFMVFRHMRKVGKRDLTSSCRQSVLSDRQSVRTEDLCYHWTDFHEILYLWFAEFCRVNSSFIKIRQE